MFAKFARADGRITAQEIAVLENLMRNRFAFSEIKRQLAIRIFREASVSNTTFETYAKEFYGYFHRNPALLHNMIMVLLELANADGAYSQDEDELIASAIRIFGISERQYAFQRTRLRSKSAGERSEHYQRQDNFNRPAPGESLAHAYEILGCSPQSSILELKRRYRKLVKENHPDRVIAKGLPQEFVHHASERFKEIQEAYEAIAREREKQRSG
jgi:DnaJ like chaperone protein